MFSNNLKSINKEHRLLHDIYTNDVKYINTNMSTLLLLLRVSDDGGDPTGPV